MMYLTDKFIFDPCTFGFKMDKVYPNQFTLKTKSKSYPLCEMWYDISNGTIIWQIIKYMEVDKNKYCEFKVYFGFIPSGKFARKLLMNLDIIQ